MSINRNRRAELLVAIIFLLGVGTPGAQAAAQDRRPGGPPVYPGTQPDILNPIVDPNEDYRASPGDIIDIQIERAPELSGMYRVGANGTLVIKFLGRVPAQNKTQDELAAVIADGLRGRYLKNPQVTATVKQINSHAFFIQGAVSRPGVYQMEGRPSLLKLISVAGGLTANRGSTAFIIREKKAKPGSTGNGETIAGPAPAAGQPTELQSTNSSDEVEDRFELIRVNINGLFRGHFDQNMYVEPGSLVNIPPADVFFVAGEVHAPGSFELKEGTSLQQAIALAQGTTFNASLGSGLIFREDLASGKRQEIRVDIAAVMKGKAEDVAIMPNDIVIVPSSRLKSIGGALLKAFGVSAARFPRAY
jgi:polysaccharide export outer membrane protein